MSDYNFDVDVLRGQMAHQIAMNEEQLIWVLTTAINDCDWASAIEMGQLGDDIKPDEVVERLNQLSDMISQGAIS